MAPVAVLPLMLLAGCSQLVQYADNLVDNRTGRSEIVTLPATAGGVVGFIVGVPVDLAGFVVTYPVYLVQKHNSPSDADLTSTVLFPSFVLSRAGTIVFGSVFDLLEYGVYRAWLPPEAMNREQRARIEYGIDESTLPVYPVERIYGK